MPLFHRHRRRLPHFGHFGSAPLTICLCFGQVVSRFLGLRFRLSFILLHCTTLCNPFGRLVTSLLCDAFNETTSSRPLPFRPQSQSQSQSQSQTADRIGCAYQSVYILPKGRLTRGLHWTNRILRSKMGRQRCSKKLRYFKESVLYKTS